MYKFRLLLLVSFAISIATRSTAQDIKRWTLATTGKQNYFIISTKDTIFIESTFGQNPGSSVIDGGSVILRQGFQQPIPDNTIKKDTSKNNGTTGLIPCSPRDSNANFNIDFNIIENTTKCGTYYDFEYTGDVLPNMKYAWNFSVDAVPQYASTNYPKNIGFISRGTKFVRLEAGGKCARSITKTVNVIDDALVGQARSKGDIKCKGFKTGELELTIYNGTLPFAYKWGNLPDGGLQKNLPAGIYSYTVTDAKNCAFSSSIEIAEPKDSLKVVPKVKDESCTDTKDGAIELTTSGGTKPYFYVWNDNVNLISRKDLPAAVYTVTVTDNNGCNQVINNNVRVFCDKKGKDFTNTITPNGDGMNEGFEFPGLENFPGNTLEIYNRWGAIVYNKKGYISGDWQGTTNDGSQLPSGPYYYLINLNDKEKTIFAGSVTVIR